MPAVVWFLLEPWGRFFQGEAMKNLVLAFVMFAVCPGVVCWAQSSSGVRIESSTSTMPPSHAAVERAEKNLATAQSDPDAWADYCSALRAAGRFQMAARAGWRALEVSGREDPKLWVALANVFVETGHYQTAAECFARARTAGATDRESARHMAALGWQQARDGQTTQALKTFESALNFDRRDCVVIADQARLILLNGNAEEGGTRMADALECARDSRDTETLRLVQARYKTMLDPSRRTIIDRTPMSSRQRLPERFLTRPNGSATRLEIDERVTHRYLMEGVGELTLQTPEAWGERFMQPKAPDLCTVDLIDPAPQDFVLRVALQHSPDSLAEMKGRVESLGNLRLKETSEAMLPLREVQAGPFSGWMIAWTVKAEPGGWSKAARASAQGFVRSRGVDLRFQATGQGDAETIARKVAGILGSVDLVLTPP